MFYSSVAVLALSASAVVSPLTSLLHLHPHAPAPDNRITVSLYNPTSMFRDIIVDGHSYTVWSHQGITIKAPAGTVIVADSPMYDYKRGDVVATLEPQLANTRIPLK